jgi:hypothetical protein
MVRWPQTLGLSFTALLAASGTLVCCVLPAILIALGAGATLASLVVAVPQLVWLSQHKLLVFGSAGILLALAGFAIWRARLAPCPIDPELATHCRRLRKISFITYGVAAGFFVLGTLFAFVLPLIG